MKNEQQRWLIAVGGGWGVKDMTCTLEEAEEWRANKARWEHAPAIKVSYDDFMCMDRAKIERSWYLKDIDQYLSQLITTV